MLKRHNALTALPEKKLAIIAAQLIRAGRMPDPGRLADALSVAGRAGRVVRLSRDADNFVQALAANPHNGTARGALADYLQDQGIPGAHVMRRDAQRSLGDPKGTLSRQLREEVSRRQHRGRIAHPILTLTPDESPEIIGTGALNQDATDRTAPGFQLLSFPKSRVAITAVAHRVAGRSLAQSGKTISVAIARSHEELEHLIQDFPEWAKTKIREHAAHAKLPARTKKLGLPFKMARGSADTTAVRPFHRVYVSSSTREGSTVDQARAGLDSPDFHDLILASFKHPTVDGGKSGLGFWKDGAEESRIVSLADPTDIARVSAALGLAFKQKGVLHFTSSAGGSDVAHVLTVPSTDTQQIARDLMDKGVEYKTIVPDHEHGRSEVHVIDFGGTMTPALEEYANRVGASHERHIGHANVPGAETREDAAKVFADILRG